MSIIPPAEEYICDSAHIGMVRMANDRTYFMRRAAQERSAAANASAGKARKAHMDLAKHYRGLVQRKAREPAGTNA